MMDDAHRTDDEIGALADPLRRRTVTVLADRDPPVPLQELAAAVRRAETGGPGTGETVTDGGTIDDATSDDGSTAGRELTVAETLYHVHLPKLEDAGLVSFDSRSKTVRDWRSVELPGDIE